MKIMTINEWNTIEEGKLEQDLTVSEFKEKFDIADEEYEQAVKLSCSNEYGTVDLSFSDDEGDSIVVELNKENLITHIYKK